MCHYLLPIRGQNRRLNRGFFADDAIQLFLDELKKVHTRPQQYVVKLFGGGNMFDYLLKQTNSPNVSEKNISSGLMLLKSHGFTVQASDVGGFGHRKIYLELWNGDVWVQRGNSSGASRD